MDRASPNAEHLQRIASRQAGAARCDRRAAQFAYARLAVGLAALALFLFRSAWFALPLAAFAALAVVHGRILRTRDVYSRAAAFYERGVARLAGNWTGSGETGERFEDPAHPYAGDLDIFGRGSLFHLLSTARTHAGEELLAEWLRAPAALREIRERQAAVDALRPLVGLREDLAVMGEELESAAVSEPLAAWGERAPVMRGGVARIAAAALAGFAVIGVALWAAAGIAYVLPIAILLNVFVLFQHRKHVRRAAREAEYAGRDLGLLADVLRRIERERFASPRLAALRAALETEGQPPSFRIARLELLVDLLESRRNKVVAVFEPVVLWTLQSAFAVEAWRKKFGPSIRGWLAVTAEFEALSSLANYAYEHPADPFPEFDDTAPGFCAEGLAHPLLPEASVVRNDVALDREACVLVVSGSNMSGKSTLLRAVGVNAVLAQCGAPVRAARLRLSPLAVGASIRTVDSLRGGVSRFYAEIRRVRQIIDLTGCGRPVLFLLDEFLHGTNSHDRRLGAEAILAALARRGAMGMVTTHDLALAEIARVGNVHFEDYIEGGEVRFDYRLRPGVVTRSNALELMRSIGLLESSQ